MRQVVAGSAACCCRRQMQISRANLMIGICPRCPWTPLTPNSTQTFLGRVLMCIMGYIVIDMLATLGLGYFMVLCLPQKHLTVCARSN